MPPWTPTLPCPQMPPFCPPLCASSDGCCRRASSGAQGFAGGISRNARPLRISFVLGGLLLLESTAGWLDTIHCLGADPSPSNNAAEASDAVNTPILIERAPSPKWKFVFTISPAQFAYIRTFKYSRWKSNPRYPSSPLVWAQNHFCSGHPRKGGFINVINTRLRMFRESEKKSPPSNLLNGSLFFKRDLLNEFDRFPNVT